MVDATGTFKLSNLMSTCFPESVTDAEVLHALVKSSFRSDGRSRVTMTREDGDITIWVQGPRGSRSSSGAGGAGSAGGLGNLPWRESRPWQSSNTEKSSDSICAAQRFEELEQELSSTRDVAPDQQPVGAGVDVLEISDEDEEPPAGSHVEPPGRFWTVYEHEGTCWWSEGKKGGSK